MGLRGQGRAGAGAHGNAKMLLFMSVSPPMVDPVATTVSALALATSLATAWLTLFRLGTVQMTQPTLIFFGPDKPRAGAASGEPKVFLRTLLFSTAKRGRVIEHACLPYAKRGKANLQYLGSRG